MIVRSVALGERPGRFVVASAAVEGGAAPAEIGRDRHRPPGIAFLDGPRRLLVAPCPQVRELERIHVGGRQPEHKRECQEPAAAKRESRHRQQRQHEPRSFVTPLVGGPIGLLQRAAPRIAGPRAEQMVDVRIVRGEHREAPLAGPRHRPQRRHVEPRYDDLAVHALEKAPLGQWYRCALFRAHREQRHPDAAFRQRLGGVAGPRTIQSVGDEDDLPDGGTAFVEQVARHGQSEVRAAPLHRHDAGVDGREQMHEGVRVAGEGGHDEGVPREDDESGAAVAAAPEKIGDLVARPHHARRGEVGRIHRARDVEHDHPCGEGAEHRLLQPLERGTGEGEPRDDHRQGHHRPRPFAAGRAGPDDEMGQQHGIDHRLPGTAFG